MASVNSAGQLGTAPKVRKIEIRHVGPPAASDDLIKANIRVKVGDTYIRTGADDDVRVLYSTGLFYNIAVTEERVTAAEVDLIYVVQGKPTLTDIRFEGNKKYSAKKLLKKITSKTGEPLDERKIFADSQEIQKIYQKAGYQKTEVKAVPSIDDQTGRGKVTFEIKETPKVKIADVEFVGAKAFPQKKLRKVIKTRRHWMFSWITGSGVLKDEQFEEDKEKIAEFYRGEGYIDFELKEVTFDYKNPKRMVVKFVVSEGTQYKVGNVEIRDNKLFPSDQILKGAEDFAKTENNKKRGMRLGVGKTFTPKGLADDLQAIEDFYGSKGYIDVRIVADRNPNIEKGTMDIVYHVMNEDKGKSYIEKIEIRGNVRTRDKVIRRELAVSPGEVFDMVRVKRSKGRLEQMGYFDKVDTEVDPTDIPNRKNLVLGVEEASTGNFELGAGFSSVDNLVGFIGYREGNFDLFNPPYFRGGGQKFRINVQIGTKRKDYTISFTEPWFLGRKLAFGTDLYYRELNYYSDLYDITQYGTRLSLSRTLGSDFLIGNVSYTIENIGINNVDPTAPQVIRDEPSSRLISKIGSGIAYDTRNNVQLATRGQRTELGGELATTALGGDTEFYKLRLSSQWYYPGFLEGHIWELGGQAGVADNYGDTARLPLFDRFFLGGVNSLRGFRYHRVGPRYHKVDPVTGVDTIVSDEPIGGEMYWFGSLEYSVPIIERLRFALFYDIGNVYETAYSFTLGPGQKTYSDDWGIGFRLNIPRLGPLRLDYAFPISHDPGVSGSGKFQFSVGFQREF
jgi:outer membrane protein insertion porin family